MPQFRRLGTTSPRPDRLGYLPKRLLGKEVVKVIEKLDDALTSSKIVVAGLLEARQVAQNVVLLKTLPKVDNCFGLIEPVGILVDKRQVLQRDPNVRDTGRFHLTQNRPANAPNKSQSRPRSSREDEAANQA